MAGFEESNWADTAFSDRFLESADLKVVERRRMLALARSFYTHFFGTSGKTRVLDLGCGDGILTFELLKAGGVPRRRWSMLRPRCSPRQVNASRAFGMSGSSGPRSRIF